MTTQLLEDAREVLAQRGAFLVLAADRTQRDDAKGRIMTALGMLVTASPVGDRS